MTLNTRYFAIYNLVLIVLAFVILIFAYRKGFVRQLLDLLSTVAGFWLAVVLCPIVSSIVILIPDSHQMLLGRPLNTVCWFVVIYFGTRVIYWILAALFSQKKKGVLSQVNKLLGLGLGIIKVFLLGVVLSVVLQLPLIVYGDEFVTHSILAYVQPVLEALMTYWGG